MKKSLTFPRGYKQYVILKELAKPYARYTYTKIIKLAYELSNGAGSFDKTKHRGYWSGAFVHTHCYVPTGWIHMYTNHVGPFYLINEKGMEKLKSIGSKFDYLNSVPSPVISDSKEDNNSIYYTTPEASSKIKPETKYELIKKYPGCILSVGVILYKSNKILPLDVDKWPEYWKKHEVNITPKVYSFDVSTVINVKAISYSDALYHITNLINTGGLNINYQSASGIKYKHKK